MESFDYKPVKKKPLAIKKGRIFDKADDVRRLKFQNAMQSRLREKLLLIFATLQRIPIEREPFRKLQDQYAPKRREFSLPQ